MFLQIEQSPQGLEPHFGPGLSLWDLMAMNQNFSNSFGSFGRQLWFVKKMVLQIWVSVQYRPELIKNPPDIPPLIKLVI